MKVENQDCISWKNFEANCYGVDIQDHFKCLCKYLFEQGNKYSSYAKYDCFSFYVLLRKEKKKKKQTAKCLNLSSLKDEFKRILESVSSSRKKAVFFTNVDIKRYVIDKETRDNIDNIIFLCDEDILSKVRYSVDYVKKYFFVNQLFTQKWFKYQIKGEINKLKIEERLSDLNEQCIIKDLLTFDYSNDVLTPDLSLFSYDRNGTVYLNSLKKDVADLVNSFLENHKGTTNYGILVKIILYIKSIPDVNVNNIEEAIGWYNQINKEFKSDIESLNEEEKRILKLDDLSFIHLGQLLDSKLLFFESRNSELYLLNLAKDLICLNRKCVYIDTSNFSKTDSLINQFEKYLDLDYSFEDFLRYIDLNSIEHDDLFSVLIVRAKQITNEFLPLFEEVLASNRIKLVISYVEIDDKVKAYLEKENVFTKSSITKEFITSKITSKKIIERSIKRGIHFSSMLFFSQYELGCSLPHTYSYNLIKNNELCFDITENTERLISQKCDYFVNKINHYLPSISHLTLREYFYNLLSSLSELFEEECYAKKSIIKEKVLNLYSINCDYIIDLLIELELLSNRKDSNCDEVEFSTIGLCFFAKRIVQKYDEKTLFLFLRSLLLEKNFSVFNPDYSYIFIGYISYFYALNYSKELLSFLCQLKLDCYNDYNSIFARIVGVYFLFLERRKKHYLGDVFNLIDVDLSLSQKIYECFLKNASDPSSPFNPYVLGEYLRNLDLPSFDEIWTCKFSAIFETCFGEVVLDVINECNKDIKLDLGERRSLLFFLSWMLSFTNIETRNKTSDIMIKLLLDYPILCLDLLKYFKDVKDQYILERLYEITNYVLFVANVNEDEFYMIVCFIYEFVFNKEEVYSNIIIRDSSYQIIKRFVSDNKEFSEKFSKHIPPYKSNTIDWDKYTNSYGKLRSSKGCRLIIDSMEHLCYEGISEPYWGCMTFRSSLPKLPKEERELIKNYCLFLIFEKYMYSEKKFCSFDSCCDSSELTLDNRIGGKYQWIAYHEALAHLYDEYKVNIYEKNNLFIPFVLRTYYPNVQNGTENLINDAKNKFNTEYNCIQDVFNSVILMNQDETNKWIKHFNEQSIIDSLLFFITSNRKWLNIDSKLVIQTIEGSFSLRLRAVSMTDKQFIELEKIKERKETFVCHDIFDHSFTSFDEFLNKVNSSNTLFDDDINKDFDLYLNKVEDDSSSIKFQIDIGNVNKLTQRVELYKDIEEKLMIMPLFSLINKFDLKPQNPTMTMWSYKDDQFSFYNYKNTNNYSFYINENVLKTTSKNKRLVWFCRLDKTFNGEYYRDFGFITKNDHKLDKYIFSTGKH